MKVKCEKQHLAFHLLYKKLHWCPGKILSRPCGTINLPVFYSLPICCPYGIIPAGLDIGRIKQ